MQVSSKVPANFNGVSVLDYLSARFTYLPESGWRQLLQERRIFCNGAPCEATRMVVKDDVIGCELPDFEAPEVNLDYEIVYEDAWLLGINKPAGLRVHSSGKFVKSNLIYHLRHRHQPAYPEASLVNRLDADTSGLVLLARNADVHSRLAQLFVDGGMEKRYLAVVTGCPTPASGSIDLAIGPVSAAEIPRFWVGGAKAKPALTHYRTLRKLGSDFSLLELQPATGRTHQLRVHLAAIGHPIAGDGLYTMNDADYLHWRRNPPPPTTWQRQALHSHQLQFLHPVLQTSCTLTAPLAGDIEQLIQQLTAAEV
ncbi:MAG: RluA family pseudouridine synthase [Trichloromonadaceae bacterium]